jgi:hypothetical protein
MVNMRSPDFPALLLHVVGKWLFLTPNTTRAESSTAAIVGATRSGRPRQRTRRVTTSGRPYQFVTNPDFVLEVQQKCGNFDLFQAIHEGGPPLPACAAHVYPTHLPASIRISPNQIPDKAKYRAIAT